MTAYEARERFPFQWHSRVHVFLLYGKMTGEPFSQQDLVDFCPERFKMKGTNIRQELKKAVERGHLKNVPGDRWQITPLGVSVIYTFARFYRSLRPMEDEAA